MPLQQRQECFLSSREACVYVQRPWGTGAFRTSPHMVLGLVDEGRVSPMPRTHLFACHARGMSTSWLNRLSGVFLGNYCACASAMRSCVLRVVVDAGILIP